MHTLRLSRYGSLELPPRPPKAPKPPCAVEGCTQPFSSRGMCKMHADRLRNHGDPGELEARPGGRLAQPKPPCAVEGCSRPLHAHGLCGMHTARQYRQGQPGEVEKRAAGTRAKPKPPCAVVGCDRPSESTEGLCSPHVRRLRRNGDVGTASIQHVDRALRRVAGPLDRVCTVAGCTRPELASGLCNAHYQRVRSHGTTELPPRHLVHDMQCQAPGCDRRVGAGGRIDGHGYCTLHIQRVAKYGTTELPQVDHTCAAPGCKRTDHAGHGYCGLHFQRVLKYGTTELPRDDRVCAAPGCERTTFVGDGYCAKHYQRLRNNGDPLVVRSIAGKNHPNWTGDDANYETVHQRIRTSRGRASALACMRCGRPAVEWAYTGRGGDAERVDHRGYRYSLDVADYEPMCRRCHRRQDARPRPDNPGRRGGGHPYFAAHQRVRSTRGLAGTRLCVDCGEQAQEWAYNNAGGESDRVADIVRGGGVCAVHFSVDPADYDAMCKKCHRHRDALYRAQCARESMSSTGAPPNRLGGGQVSGG